MSTACILKVLAGQEEYGNLLSPNPKCSFELMPAVRIYAENNGKLSVPSGTVGTMGLRCYKIYDLIIFVIM